MRLASIDIGTNTVQLLIADLGDEGIHRLHTAERFVRLGEGVDEQGHINDAATLRLCRTLEEYLTIARSWDVDEVIAAGTSTLRDASNRSELVATVDEHLGLNIDILSGPEEATWSFVAACAPFDDLTGSCLVIDIGGGSMELISGRSPSASAPQYQEAITDRASLEIGCVRLTERYFSSLPPSSESIREVNGIIEEALASAPLEGGPEPTLIGTAGTATALALVHAGPESTWEAFEDRTVALSRAEVQRWSERLLQQSVDQIRALHPEAMEGRADVFPVGVLLLEHVLQHYHIDTVRVSPYELRHGLALRVLAQTSSA